MFQISKNEPDYFNQAKKRVSTPKLKEAWDDNNIKDIRSNLREHILLHEQNLLCAYCEKEIDAESKNSNIDHFKTRHLYPNETLEYRNLLVSCNSKISCSHIKDNYRLTKEDYTKIINPIYQNPNDYFEYGFAGDILIKNDLSKEQQERAEFSIEIFNLNHKSLIDNRKFIAESLEVCLQHGCEIDDMIESFNGYTSFIMDIYKKLQEVKK